MTAVEILKKARALISSPEHWTQHAMAKSKGQIATDTFGELAHCFCATGAVMRQADAPEALRIQAIRSLNAGIPADFPQEHCLMTRVIQYNDTKSHSEVLTMFDSTIAQLEAVDDRCS